MPTTPASPRRSVLFHSDFSDASLTGFRREQHTPDGYPDFVIRNESLVILDAGNRLIPVLPDLRDCLVETSIDADWEANEGRFSFHLFFDYQPRLRRGKSIELRSDASILKVIYREHDRIVAEETLPDDVLEHIRRTRRIDFAVEATETELMVSVAGETRFTRSISRAGGALAFARGIFPGVLKIKSLTISSSDVFEEQIVMEETAIPFAPINGMDTPIVWKVGATRIGTVVRLDVSLDEGVKSRPNLEWFIYHATYREELTRPYLRIESLDGSILLPLSSRTLTLNNPRSKYFYLLGPERPEWPLNRSFYLEALDLANAAFHCGYDEYRCRTPNSHLAAGPTETVYDIESGRTVYAGPALPRDGATLDIRSSESKRICREIPNTVHEYEKALDFAKRNHYFFDDEICEFSLVLHHRLKDDRGELRGTYRLLDAFLSPISKWEDAVFSAGPESLTFDIEETVSDPIGFNAIGAGVYHLEFRLYRGNEILSERHRAFEVMSESQNGPEASGLPVLFSFASEVMGIDTDMFDPWKTDCVDASHYFSIDASIMPHIAGEKRLWELFPLYKREWFLWLTKRTTAQNYDLEANRELVEHCDYLQTPNAQGGVFLYRLPNRSYYSGSQLEILREFAVKRDVRVKEIDEAIENRRIVDKKTFDELVVPYYREWVSYFQSRFAQITTEKKQQIAKYSKTAKFSDYGPVAIYVGAYRTVHSIYDVSGLSAEVADAFDGIFIFEDYPHACRYPINRGPFLFAGMKMAFPNWRIAPEMYAPTGNPCPDGAVARAWPSNGIWAADHEGNFHFPVERTMKRVLEYVFAAVWHDGEAFRYWNDHIIHARTWELERIEALLKIWKFVTSTTPARPLKANAFICNEACCEQHEVYYDEYPSDIPGDPHEAMGDLFNTAEESVAYAYEMSRAAGQNAGFVADFPSLNNLGAEDIDTLVLPPLSCVTDEDLDSIRRLHEAGVSLLAFEDVGGLEDLFGVTPGAERRISKIRVADEFEDNPVASLSGLEEYVTHRACKAKYDAAGARVLLAGEAPVLFSHTTRWGKTALFNVPPTTVRRQDQSGRASLGRDTISELVNESAKLMLRYLSRPQIEVDSGKCIAFQDDSGNIHVIVEEDAHPIPASPIWPLVTLHVADADKREYSCTREFSIVSQTSNTVRIRLFLDNDEYAIISVK